MRHLFGPVLCLTIGLQVLSQKPTTRQLPRVFLLDATTLAEQKQRCASDPNDELASTVREAADRAIPKGPFSVMNKQAPPPSCEKHHYRARARHCWAHPT